MVKEKKKKKGGMEDMFRKALEEFMKMQQGEDVVFVFGPDEGDVQEYRDAEEPPKRAAPSFTASGKGSYFFHVIEEKDFYRILAEVPSGLSMEEIEVAYDKPLLSIKAAEFAKEYDLSIYKTGESFAVESYRNGILSLRFERRE